MSVKVMGLVWDEQMDRSMKFVLLAYADHADHEGGSIYPAIETIAKKTGYDARSVQRITTNLESAGYLVLEPGHDRQGGPGKSTRWRIPIKGDKIAPIPKGDKTNKQRVTKRTQRVTKNAVKGDTVSPDPSSTVCDPSLDPSEENTANAVPPKSPTPQQAMVEALSFVTGFDIKLHGARLGKSASKLVKAGYDSQYIWVHYCDSYQDCWWYANDWRGQKGEMPTPEQVVETIGRVDVIKKNGKQTPQERNIAALHQLMQEENLL